MLGGIRGVFEPGLLASRGVAPPPIKWLGWRRVIVEVGAGVVLGVACRPPLASVCSCPPRDRTGQQPPGVFPFRVKRCAGPLNSTLGCQEPFKYGCRASEACRCASLSSRRLSESEHSTPERCRVLVKMVEKRAFYSRKVPNPREGCRKGTILVPKVPNPREGLRK